MQRGDPLLLLPLLPIVVIRCIGEFVGRRCNICDERRGVLAKSEDGEWDWICIDCFEGINDINVALCRRNNNGEWNWIYVKDVGRQPRRRMRSSNSAYHGGTSRSSPGDPRDYIRHVGLVSTAATAE